MHLSSPIPLQLQIAWIALAAALLWLANKRQGQSFRAIWMTAQNGDHNPQFLKRKVFVLRKLARIYFFAVGSIVVVNIYTQRKRGILTTITDQRQEIRSFAHLRRLREGRPVDNLWITFGRAGERGKGCFAVRGSGEDLGGGSASQKLLGFQDLHEAETSWKGVPDDHKAMALHPLPGSRSPRVAGYFGEVYGFVALRKSASGKEEKMGRQAGKPSNLPTCNLETFTPPNSF